MHPRPPSRFLVFFVVVAAAPLLILFILLCLRACSRNACVSTRLLQVLYYATTDAADEWTGKTYSAHRITPLASSALRFPSSPSETSPSRRSMSVRILFAPIRQRGIVASQLGFLQELPAVLSKKMLYSSLRVWLDSVTCAGKSDCTYINKIWSLGSRLNGRRWVWASEMVCVAGVSVAAT